MLYLNDILTTENGEWTNEGLQVVNTLLAYDAPFSPEAIKKASEEIDINAEDLKEFFDDKANFKFKKKVLWEKTIHNRK